MDGCSWVVDPEAKKPQECSAIIGSRIIVVGVVMPRNHGFPVCPKHAVEALEWARSTYGSDHVKEVSPSWGLKD